MDRGWRELEKHDRESLNCLEQTFSRNLDFEDTVSAKEVRNMLLRKGDLSFAGADSSVTHLPSCAQHGMCP